MIDRGYGMGKAIWSEFCERTESMRRNALSDVRSIEDWRRIRASRYIEFLHSMGLHPFPEKCDPKMTDYGAFSGPGYTARRIGFQIFPDCWTSACVYYPINVGTEPLPGVLYVCGHGGAGTVSLQSHPILWARRGYACMILDTIEQNDNPGEHHGFDCGLMDAWISLGYTAAGGELWNAIRALDVFLTDPRVDSERIGVTGVSGGGACSFHLAMADERVKAVSTLCGISTPYDAIVNRHLIQHCNCMYPYNIYRRDTSEYAALIAPRPALFCFADDDRIFHADETRAFVERTGKIYRLYGEEDKCERVTCPGGHGDHQAFDEATSRWFDRHVAGNQRPILKRGERENPERVVSVFNGCPPVPNRLHLLPELLSPRGTVALPRTPEEWPAIGRGALESLSILSRETGHLTMRQAAEWRADDRLVSEHRGDIDGIDVRIDVIGPDEEGLPFVLAVAGPGVGSLDVLGDVYGAVSGENKVRCGGFESRLSGLNAHSAKPPGFSIEKCVAFAFPLAGSTRITVLCHDIRAAVDYLFRTKCVVGNLYLYGKGDAGVAALYCALLDERVTGVVIEDSPRSHETGAPIPGILRVFDIQQAAGLMAPRKVALVNPGHNYWSWTQRVFERLDCPDHFLIAGTLREAMEALSD